MALRADLGGVRAAAAIVAGRLIVLVDHGLSDADAEQAERELRDGEEAAN
jgi:hypothetical protein